MDAGLKAALTELRRRFDQHITERGYGAHLDRHAAEHKDVAGTLDRIPTGVGGSAPSTSSYVTISAEAGLASERRVAAGNAIGLTDGGANSTLTIALSIAGQVIGDIIYHTGAAWDRLAGNTTTTKKFLTQTGDGVASAAPGWGTIVAADLPVGIADDKIVQIDSADVADNDFAKFTAAGLEGRSYAEVRQDLDLEDADINTLADTVADGLIATHTAIAAAHHAAVTVAADLSPLVTLSTQELSFGVQDANHVLAGPTSGAAADPTMRHLVAADIPALAYVANSLYDVQSILAATADDTPAAVTLAQQTVLGRLTGGNIDDIVIGILDDNILQVDHTSTAAVSEYARFTANGLESRTEAEFKGDYNLENADINALAVAAVEAEATLDLTGDVTVAAAKTLALDHVIEKTAAHGIVLDGVQMKDNQVYSGVDDVSGGAFYAYGGTAIVGGKVVLYTAADSDAVFEDFSVEVFGDDLRVRHNAADDLLVNADRSVEIVTGPLKVDHINEYAAGHGVDIDGVLCKDDAVETDAIRGLRETSGPTSLTVGTITDGEFLKRVGATVVSAAAGGGAAHAILDGSTHNDSVGDAVSAGSIIIGNDTPKWDELVITVPGAANLLDVFGTVNGDTMPGYKVLFDGTAPEPVGTAAAGTGVVAAHRNHVHAGKIARCITFTLVGNLAAVVFPPYQLCVGAAGEHGTFTFLHATASCTTKGEGTNTIIVEVHADSAFGAATELFTLALNAEQDITDAPSAWLTTDNWIRVRCSEISLTVVPTNVVVQVFFTEAVWA